MGGPPSDSSQLASRVYPDLDVFRSVGFSGTAVSGTFLGAAFGSRVPWDIA